MNIFPFKFQLIVVGVTFLFILFQLNYQVDEELIDDLN